MRALIWFRSDPRIADNTALHHACADADDGVVAVFAITPVQWAQHHWGSMKVDFILRSLAALSTALSGLHIPLRLIRVDRFDEVPDKLLNLARRHNCAALYFNEEYEVNERRRDQSVIDLFEADDRAVRAFTDQVILDVGAFRTTSDGWYKVYTPFKRRWCAALKEQGPPRRHPQPSRQAALDLRPDDVPSRLEGFTDHRRADLWPAGESPARQRLDAFVADAIGDYHTNRDLPAVDGTSALSPYLAAGVISPRQCLHAALEANGGRADSGRKGVTTWIGELIWREFYRHVLLGFPHVGKDRPFKPATADLRWRNDEDHFAAWCVGQTGFPLVDTGMRQLNETGWMHNRLRMVVAMFLTKDLFIDWRWGERYFLNRLVDGDFANNNGGWQWSASTGTDAAPYFRVFNPFTQSRRYDPDGRFIRRWVPELADLGSDEIHEPHERAGLYLDYPSPIVDRRDTRDRVISAFKALSGSS